MNRYLISCPCAHRIAVTASQAGGTVTCPECNASRPVPRLGQLVELEMLEADPVPNGRPAWNARRAWLLAGVVVAVVAAATAGWLRGRRSGVATFDDRALRTAVAAAAVDQVHATWLTFERQGIERPRAADEELRQRYARGLATLERIAWVVAAVGSIIAAGATVVLALGRRPG